MMTVSFFWLFFSFSPLPSPPFIFPSPVRSGRLGEGKEGDTRRGEGSSRCCCPPSYTHATPTHTHMRLIQKGKEKKTQCMLQEQKKHTHNDVRMRGGGAIVPQKHTRIDPAPSHPNPTHHASSNKTHPPRPVVDCMARLDSIGLHAMPRRRRPLCLDGPKFHCAFRCRRPAPLPSRLTFGCAFFLLFC